MEMADKTSPDLALWYVSYAWEDESTSLVNRLCGEAKQRGIKVLRDVTELRFGESISQFMQKVGAGDRVFVILSGKYLKSPSCMFELWEVWRNCKMKGEEFQKRIKVYRLKDAKMMTTTQRLSCAEYWNKEFTRLDARVRRIGTHRLGEVDFKRYKLMNDFASHVGDMLALIADSLIPGSFEEFKEYGFSDRTTKPRMD